MSGGVPVSAGAIALAVVLGDPAPYRWACVQAGMAACGADRRRRPLPWLADAIGVTSGTLRIWTLRDPALGAAVTAWAEAHTRTEEEERAVQRAAVARACRQAGRQRLRALGDLVVLVDGQEVRAHTLRGWARRDPEIANAIAAWQEGGTGC